jgi:hypothetical protein
VELMPQFWDFMMTSLFRVQNKRLRQQLWDRYPKSTALSWQIQRCGERAPSEQAMYERVKQLCQHIDPVVLLRAADGLAPLGRGRPQDIIDFEEVVLGLMDKHGKFKWLPEGHANGQKRATPHRPA